MHLGVLVTASHAISTRTLFSVFYKPRTSRSEFIVSVNKYLEAKNHKLYVGMRFNMKFEGDEALERRFSGTIICVWDTTSSRWTDSEWRSLKVQWDEPSGVQRPDSVSPWELEPLGATATPLQSLPSQESQRTKRARPPVLISTEAEHLSVFGRWKSPADNTQTFSFSGLQRGRESYNMPNPTSPFSPMSKHVPTGIDVCSGVTINSLYWHCMAATQPQIEPLPASTSKEPCETKHTSRNGCRLFGIQLTESSTIEEAEASPAGGSIREDRLASCLAATSQSTPATSQSTPATSIIKEFFKSAGEVVAVRLATSEDGSFRGFGHVEFGTKDAAQKALEMNGQELLRHPIRLDLARERGALILHIAEMRPILTKREAEVRLKLSLLKVSIAPLERTR